MYVSKGETNIHAKGETNIHAINFYDRLGFNIIRPNIMKYIYEESKNTTGGRIRKNKSIRIRKNKLIRIIKNKSKKGIKEIKIKNIKNTITNYDANDLHNICIY